MGFNEPLNVAEIYTSLCCWALPVAVMAISLVSICNQPAPTMMMMIFHTGFGMIRNSKVSASTYFLGKVLLGSIASQPAAKIIVSSNRSIVEGGANEG